MDTLIKLLPFIIPKADEALDKGRSIMSEHQKFVDGIVRQINESTETG